MNGDSGGKGRSATAAAVTVAAVLLLPVTLTAVGVAQVAYWRGWSPLRSRYVVLGAVALLASTWAAGWSPLDAARAAYQLTAAGQYLSAGIAVTPVVVGLGVPAGALVWAKVWQMARRGEIRSPLRAGQWSSRQFRHAMARAASEARRPALVPMRTGRKDRAALVLGRAGLLTEGGAGGLVPRDPRLFTVPYGAMGHHLVVVGAPGVGKTVALLRLMRSWSEEAWLRHSQGGGDRPLLIFLDCKGGQDGEGTSADFARMCVNLGLERGRIGVWPRDDRLDLWSLPVPRLVEVLHQMVVASHPYYDDLREDFLGLAVDAPGGPPVSSVDFVQRLDPQWLMKRWPPESAERHRVETLQREFASIAARYAVLFRKIGRSLDAGRDLDDLDALSAVVQGTENAKTAASLAQALVELVTGLATRRNGAPRRRVLFVLDEFSAVSERVNIRALMERARSMGVGIVPAAQSWHGLGADPDEREALLSAAKGGILALGLSDPEKIAARAGTRVVVESGTHRLSSGYGAEGTGRAQASMVAPHDWFRHMLGHPGYAVYQAADQALWGAIAPPEFTVADAPARTTARAIERVTPKAIEGPRISLDDLEAGHDWLAARLGGALT